MSERVTYAQTRPWPVVDKLDGLHGPTSGTITLPNSLCWSGRNEFDLSREQDLIRVYEIVLGSAVRPDEVADWLDGPILCRLWSQLFLPRQVRQAWEARHLQLAATAA